MYHVNMYTVGKNDGIDKRKMSCQILRKKEKFFRKKGLEKNEKKENPYN